MSSHKSYCRLVISHYAAVAAERRAAQELPIEASEATIDAQAERSAELVTMLRKRSAVLLDDPVGTGKTIVALATAARLLDLGAIERILIVAPNATVADQWESRARDTKANGAYFTTVAARSSRQRPNWSAGMVRVVTRRELDGIAAPNSTWPDYLVVVDEAHRGLQREGPFHTKLSNWSESGKLLLVTATPFQMSMTGLTTMLKTGGAKQRDLDLLRSFGHAASRLVKQLSGGLDPEESNTSVTEETQRQFAELHSRATDVLRRFRGDVSLGASLDVPAPPDLDDPAVLCSVAVSHDWSEAFEVARIIPDMVLGHNGDAFRRRLVSSSEAFWQGAAGAKLKEHRNVKPVARLIRALDHGLGSGTGHPKVAHTVTTAAELASDPDPHHVLIFCVWKESAEVIARELKALRNRSFDVERPGTSISDTTRKRLERPPGDDRPLVLVLQDRFAESIDLDGGRPYLIHHDLPWNPARVRQRWGRVVRASSGFQPPAGVHVPVLQVHIDQRLHETVVRRAQIGDSVLIVGDSTKSAKRDQQSDEDTFLETGVYEDLNNIILGKLV